MSSTAQGFQNPAPSSTKAPKDKAVVACYNCRRAKVKCEHEEDARLGGPKTCTRCERRNYLCEYAPSSPWPIGIQAYNVPSNEPPMLAHSGRSWPSLPPTSGAGQPPVYARQSPSPALPHTYPPPLNSVPRYSQGTPYPDLTLDDPSYMPPQGQPRASYPPSSEMDGYQGQYARYR
uniref:Zn(2)-C6 fungal-type domain-containing protein n=1 Tax=Mycena chlorophos TaxID=658473 RepID=A0ABQ0LD39_MYCCL|nr:predicted protein [Mycena chlorophos]